MVILVVVVVVVFLGRALDLPRAFESGWGVVTFGTDRVDPVLASLLVVLRLLLLLLHYVKLLRLKSLISRRILQLIRVSWTAAIPALVLTNLEFRLQL